MAQEIINFPPRELNFYGEGKAFDIKQGFVITSLRNPRSDYEFSKGERILANCQDDGDKIPVVVIANETKPLYAFSNPQLLLDGFYSSDNAAINMRGYPGYENTNKNSELQAITFVKEEVFNALDSQLKEDIMGPEKSFDDLIKTKELRHIFFPTLCRHIVNNGDGIVSWMEYLGFSKLVPWEELEKIKKAEFRSEHAGNYYQYHIRHTRSWEELVNNHPKAIVFQALVCLQPDRKNYY